jgi:hypothetical protein
MLEGAAQSACDTLPCSSSNPRIVTEREELSQQAYSLRGSNGRNGVHQS